MPFVSVRYRWSHSAAHHTSPTTQSKILQWHALPNLSRDEEGSKMFGSTVVSYTYLGRCSRQARGGEGMRTAAGLNCY